eukprot:1615489-Pleurochrysis_carterae.AAC.1
MTAWKSNAAFEEERDRLATNLRGAVHRVDRSDVLASRALDWRREADELASAKSERKRAMTSYNTTKGELAEERRLHEMTKEECKQLRAE